MDLDYWVDTWGRTIFIVVVFVSAAMLYIYITLITVKAFGAIGGIVALTVPLGLAIWKLWNVKI